jgi:type III secretory pathway component EscV
MKNATRIFTSTFGTIMALAGAEHGIGEVLQGNKTPSSLMILSWPDSAFFRGVGGEPAMTVIPNIFISGILTILISLVLLVWVLLFVQRKHGGLVMALISFILLLVGGGLFPPILAMLIAAAAGRIHAPLTWWRTHLSKGLRQVLARLRPWFFGFGILSFLLLLPGLEILDQFLGVNDPNLILIFLCSMMVFFILTILTGFARDSLVERQPNYEMK